VSTRGGFEWRPDPGREHDVQPKGVKLVRRGPRAFSIVWRTPDGKDVETPLAGSGYAASS
jgi:hypothetical protein